MSSLWKTGKKLIGYSLIDLHMYSPEGVDTYLNFLKDRELWVQHLNSKIDEIYKRVLTRSISDLRKNLDPDLVVPYLISKEIITDIEEQKLAAINVRQDKVSMLVSMIKRKGKTGYKTFISALLEYESIHKHLIDKLSSIEVSITDETEAGRKVTTEGQKTPWDGDTTLFPEDNESSEDDSTTDDDETPDFNDLLIKLGLHQRFVTKLKLHDFLTIKGPNQLKSDIGLVELFWQTLSSLDYRARTNSFLNEHKPPDTKQISVKDFIFAIMHCCDRFLRQDIIEKMSACQLAVPVVLRGVKGGKPELLTWSLRRVVKKWKEEHSIALEEYMVKYPVFTISFLRIGEIKRVSKSAILNTLLGPCQGNERHPYFLCKDDDPCSSGLSQGCVESVWYLPMNTNGSAKLKKLTSFLNLRGDSMVYPAQTRFVCQTANLTVVLIAKRNQKKFGDAVAKIASMATLCKIIAVNDERVDPPRKCSKLKWKDDWLFVRFMEMDNLCNEICSIIASCREKFDTASFQSLEQMQKMCSEDIDVEENDEIIQKAKRFVTAICNPKDTQDLTVYKQQSFPLQPIWKNWVEIDRQRLKPDIPNAKPIEELREEISTRKNERRQKQLRCGLSETMQKFCFAIEKAGRDSKKLAYFVSYLQEELFCLADENVRKHFANIVHLEKGLSNLDVRINKITSDTSGKEDIQDTEIRLKKTREEYKRHHQHESDLCKQKSIGWEHFVRELGQWYEAHDETDVEKDITVSMLPGLASGLLVHGYSLEIMDGDTGHVALSWVTSVLDQLASDLHDPSILVLCVVGVQSSGKSTLLNSMFGVRFPVRAGRCTRGLFVRLIEVDKVYVDKVGFQYILLIDSEGIRSLERTAAEEYRFDNELVTLALCISDLTILNIEGENIGPDMTGLLQIAAHAMIRMKEVDIHSQCRIIQQRVSDLTANQRNKENMKQVIDTLNEATIIAAKEEGFGERYQQFSDVFDLRLDENLQFIPCLWTGPMSPPSQFYGGIIMKLKVDILNDVECKKLEPQYTILTFTHRIRDVWRAVKSENFLFNFQDSVKAIDFNNLSMKLNEWVIEMRITLGEKQADWRRRIKDSKSADGSTSLLEDLKKECHDELEAQKIKIQKSFRTFVSEHKRRDTLSKYDKRVNQSLNDIITDIQRDVQLVLKSDDRIKQFQRDISSVIAKIRSKLLEQVQNEKEISSPSQDKVQNSACSKGKEPDEIFTIIWKKCLTDIQPDDFQSQSVVANEIEAISEDLLLSITNEKAISSKIDELMKLEGGIQNHLDKPDWRNYFPPKRESKNIEEWFCRYERSLQDIIDKSVEEMKNKSRCKSFDANLMQLILQSALQNLSLEFETSEPPYLLKGKALLHICSKLSRIALENQRLYEDENSFETLLEKEKNKLRKEFFVLLASENKTQQVLSYLKSFLTDWLKDNTLGVLKGRIIQYTAIGARLADKCWLIRAILEHLSQQESLEEYIQYIKNHRQYIIRWVNNQLVKLCTGKPDENSLIETIANNAIDDVRQDLSELINRITAQVKDDKEAKDQSMQYRKWVTLLMEELCQRGFLRHRELASLLLDNKTPDLASLVKGLEAFLQDSLKDDIIRETNIPNHPKEEQVKMFLSTLFVDLSEEMLKGMCFEQCPICKAACENNWPAGSHHEHTTSTHIPRGLSGIIRGKTKQLMLNDCLSCVNSVSASYIIPGDKKKHLCKDYKVKFPSWTIKPQGDVPNYENYWKWVMARFNRPLADRYKCEQANIPQSWAKITKNEASSALAYSVIKVPYTPEAMVDMLMSKMADQLKNLPGITFQNP